MRTWEVGGGRGIDGSLEAWAAFEDTLPYSTLKYLRKFKSRSPWIRECDCLIRSAQMNDMATRIDIFFIAKRRFIINKFIVKRKDRM